VRMQERADSHAPAPPAPGVGPGALAIPPALPRAPGTGGDHRVRRVGDARLRLRRFRRGVGGDGGGDDCEPRTRTAGRGETGSDVSAVADRERSTPDAQRNAVHRR